MDSFLNKMVLWLKRATFNAANPLVDDLDWRLPRQELLVKFTTTIIIIFYVLILHEYLTFSPFSSLHSWENEEGGVGGD